MRPLPLPGPAEAAGPLDLRSWPSSWRRRVGLWCEGSTGGRWCSGPRRWGRCWVRPAVHSDPPWPNNARVLGCMFGMGTRLTYAVVEGGALLVVVCGTPVLVHPALSGTRTLTWHRLWLFGSQGPVPSGRGLGWTSSPTPLPPGHSPPAWTTGPPVLPTARGSGALVCRLASGPPVLAPARGGGEGGRGRPQRGHGLPLSRMALCAPNGTGLSWLAPTLGAAGGSREPLRAPGDAVTAEAGEPCAQRPQPLAPGSSHLGGTDSASSHGWADPYRPAEVLAPGAAAGGCEHPAGFLLAGSVNGGAARRCFVRRRLANRLCGPSTAALSLGLILG